MFGFNNSNSRDVAFKQVPQGEDGEFIGAELKDFESLQSSQRRGRSSRSRIYPTLIIVFFAFIAGSLSSWVGGKIFKSDLNKQCINRVSKYSPLLEDVDISYSEKLFNGSLMYENIYRQTGSPEVDAAWSALGVDFRPAVVPVELAAKAGLLESQVQISPKYGGGYPANVEGLHHLHCLNLLRQALYFNFPYYSAKGETAFSNEPHIVRVHVTHCLDIIRQQLMCSVDVAVLGQVWWNKNIPAALPDFNTKHTCRNFEAVREWAREHQVPETVPEDYILPPRSVEDVYETMP